MQRRLAILTAAATAIGAVEVANAQAKAKERVVIQVSTPEQKLWNQAINYLGNLRQLYGPDSVEIELVALGHGLGILKLDSTQGTRIAEARKMGVIFSACQTTMDRQKLSPADMLPDIGYVPAGLGQIIARQREGWAYINA